jgi:methyl-accepting chemotaxis protein
VTIRAKLYLAIALTVVAPVVTIAVALHGMSRLDDRFDEVQQRASDRALALELKFGVTDVNGWQTAWGYDDRRSRPTFEASVADFRRDLRAADEALTDPQERALLRELNASFEDFMRLDEQAWTALQAGRPGETKRILLGPEIDNFEAMAGTAERLAGYAARQAGATEAAFDDTRDDVRKRLIAVALGATVVIVLLLLTASDIARLAIEGDRQRRGPVS